MNLKPTCIFALVISLLGPALFGQQDSIHLETEVLVQDTLDVTSIQKKDEKKAGRLFAGADLFSLGMAAFTDKKGAQGVISYRVYKKWNAVLEVGYEKHNYDDLDWKVDAKGAFFKIGFNWFISQDFQNPSNGFYLGSRIAYSPYKQKINQYPIRLWDNQVSEYGSLPEENVSALWMEFVGGGRIQLVSNLYADVSMRPKVYIGGKKQEGIHPLVIPDFGKDSGNFNFSVFWGLTWKLF